jgi:Concanavalin A-like lectin/glucanases superfamily
VPVWGLWVSGATLGRVAAGSARGQPRGREEAVATLRPPPHSFTPGTGNFRIQLSVRCTARPSSAVGDYDLLRRGLSTTSGGDDKVEILQSGKAHCEFRGSGGAGGVSGGPALSDGRWHTIGCSRTASAVVLTVHGASYTTARRTGSITSAVTVYIGAKDGSGGDQYTGLMDSMSISKG